MRSGEKALAVWKRGMISVSSTIYMRDSLTTTAPGGLILLDVIQGQRIPYFGSGSNVLLLQLIVLVDQLRVIASMKPSKPLHHIRGHHPQAHKRL
jgi:hypothetical protein